MRKVLLFMLCALCLFSFQKKETDGFTINGTLKGDAEGGKVTLMNPYVDPPVKLDSAIVKDGKFKLAGKIDSPSLYAMILDLSKPGEEPDTDNKLLRIDIYIENKDITVEGDVANLQSYYYNPKRTGKAVIKGSTSQALADQLAASIANSTRELSKLDQQYSNEYIIPEMEGKDATKRGIEIVKAEKPFNKQIKEATWKFIRENPSSVVAFNEASSIINGYSVPYTSAEVDELLSLLEGPWAGTKQLEEFKKKAPIAKKLGIGEPYIDIELLNNKGEKVMLSSLMPKNKYVLVEFWASWCGPCRGEIPHLAKIHKKYKDFEIISISVDDKDSEWQKAMKEEGMVWTQLRNPDGSDGAIAAKYNITGVPTCMLLDKKGHFYKTNMRGAYLDEFLLETYGK